MHRALLRPLLLALVATSGCDDGGREFRVRTSAASTPGRLWLISQAQADGVLLFVLFEGGPSTEEGFPSRLKVSVSSGRTSAELALPDGSVARLPGKVQLMEVVDGVYRESERTVTLAELEAFVDSKPAAYTIAELLRFVNGIRR